MKKTDLTGKKIGKWNVLESFRKNGKVYWKCVCDCGNKGECTTSTLNSGRSKSCGCGRSESSKKQWEKYRAKLPEGYSGKIYFYNIYKNGAKSRNLEFKLEKNEFIDIIGKNCTYCNTSPRQYSLGNSCSYKLICNGVDRVDSNIGYLINNCVPCCSVCNVMKSNLSEEEFTNHIKQIHDFLKLGENNE